MKAFCWTLLAIIGLSLAGCGYNYTSMEMGYKHGEYVVADLKVVPRTPEIGQDPDYLSVKKTIDASWKKLFAGKGHGRPVTITVQIDAIKISSNTYDQLLGNPYYIISTNRFYDEKTGTLVATNTVNAPSTAPDLISSVTGLNTDRLPQYRLDAISWYMYHLQRAIYPPRN